MNANRDNLYKLDYIIIEKGSLVEKDYKLRKATGKTRSDEVNKKFHLNIERLSGINLVELAKFLSEKAKLETVRRKDVLEKVVSSISKGEIDIERLEDKLKKKVEEAIN